MVYCGKPSRGCQMCRTRRIKCDETKPICLQCQKSRRQCPGYKDDFDLVFRNETQATERRARKAVNKRGGNTQIILATAPKQSDGSGSLITPNSDTEMSMSVHGRSAQSQFLSYAPAIPIEQQAPSFFVANYVLPSTETQKPYFHFLLPVLQTEAPGSHLSLAFRAVALVCLANKPNRKGTSLFAEAIGAYTKALKAVNLALQNPALVKTDQTLASILLMGFFENIASEKTNPMAWYSHVEGAVQLVKLRGKKQLRTKIGLSLFMTVRSQMIIQCMTASKVPSLGTDWWFMEEAGEHDFGAFIMRLSLRIAELRATVNTSLASFPRDPEHFQKVLEYVRTANTMEHEYQTWEATTEAQLFAPKTVAWVDQVPGGDLTKAEVFPGRVDMYEDVWKAMSWNHARIARLFISGTIVRCAAWICSPVDYRTTPEYAQAVRISNELVTDIIASVPFHLGWRVDEEGTLRQPARAESDTFATATGAGGALLMWPLFTVSNMDYTSDSQRKWTKGRMLFLSEMLGLNHAKVLSSFELRLPSMIIRRDSFIHSPPSAALIAAAAARGYSLSPSPIPQHANPHPHVTTQTLNKITSVGDWRAANSGKALTHTPPHNTPSPRNMHSPNSNAMHSPNGEVMLNAQGREMYRLNPLQQREQMQMEALARDRKSLLKKASNSQGETTERLLANYLAV